MQKPAPRRNADIPVRITVADRNVRVPAILPDFCIRIAGVTIEVSTIDHERN